MSVIAVLNYKGGAGKTTLSVHVAAAAYSSGLPVIGLDADPQGSAIAWSAARENPPKFTPVNIDTVENMVIKGNGRDRLVVIDTGPRLDMLAAKIAKLADLILIPVKPSIFDELAVGETIKMLVRFGLQNKARIVLNEVNPRVAEVNETRVGLAESGVDFSPFILGDRVHFKRSVNQGQGVCEAFPTGAANMEMQQLFAYVRGSLHI